MALFALGINHKTAVVDVREQLAFKKDHLREALCSLKSTHLLREAAILSTCNRTEVYGEAGDSRHILNWLARYGRISTKILNDCYYCFNDKFAVHHMMRVASGLDSMVLGEPQILGQMKQAYALASQAGTVGKHLGRLFQMTFSVAKRVRSDTSIGENPVSFAFAAIKVASHIFSDMTAMCVLLIGAGEMIELMVRYLHQQGVKDLLFANRTFAKAQQLATCYGGRAIEIDLLGQHLSKPDMVVSATDSPVSLVTHQQINAVLKQRQHRPMLLVDLAVPRNIDSRINQFDDIYLYSIDDLQHIIAKNSQARAQEAVQAEKLIDVHATRYMDWLQSLDSVALVRQYREQGAALRDKQVEKALYALNTGACPETVVSKLAHSLAQQMMHQPTVAMREAGRVGDVELLHCAQKLLLDKKDK